MAILAEIYRLTLRINELIRSREDLSDSQWRDVEFCDENGCLRSAVTGTGR